MIANGREAWPPKRKQTRTSHFLALQGCLQCRWSQKYVDDGVGSALDEGRRDKLRVSLRMIDSTARLDYNQRHDENFTVIFISYKVRLEAICVGVWDDIEVRFASQVLRPGLVGLRHILMRPPYI